jgi:hypothetical protein
MSHGMLHHIESKYSLNCCIYLIWFEFETWFQFELKTLEKLNRKAIRNSLEIEKAISAHLAQAGPASRAPCVWQAGPACRRMPERAHSPLSLAAPWGRPVGASFLACAHSPSLCPTVASLLVSGELSSHDGAAPPRPSQPLAVRSWPSIRDRMV